MQFIIGNRRCAAQFPERGWYSHGKYEYNEVMYQPTGWKAPYRFVVMRISKEEKGNRQLPLLEEDRYMHRVFVTNLKSKPHKVITLYDGRANAENAIKEAQQEGIQAIPSKRYQSNSVFFQLVMLNYNLWHWMKAYFSFVSNQDAPQSQEIGDKPKDLSATTLRIVRLRLLFISAKLRYHESRDQVRYSMHDQRSEELIYFMNHMKAVKDRRKIA